MKIEAIPLLQDNYAFALIEGEEMAIIDPSEAKPILDFVEKHGYRLSWILNTHHHHDHIGGNLTLKEASGAKIIASAYDQGRIPGQDIALRDGDSQNILGHEAKIIFIPGHTKGHIAYYFADNRALFCGDTLFSIGCGRLFEGTPQQMWHSLSRLAELPDDTRVYCGHEYTEANCRFAVTIDPENEALIAYIKEVKQKRANGLPTIPSILGTEKKANPFLRANDLKFLQKLGFSGYRAEDVFAEIRGMKDRF